MTPRQSETFVLRAVRGPDGVSLFLLPAEATTIADMENTMNNVKTMVLMAGLMGLFLLAGQLLGGSQGLVLALVLGSAFNFIMYFFSDRMVLRMYGARVVTEAEAPGALPDGGPPAPAGRPADAEGGGGAARAAQCLRHRAQPRARRASR